MPGIKRKPGIIRGKPSINRVTCSECELENVARMADSTAPGPSGSSLYESASND